ncbi:MAG: hypothetical protein ACR2MQ_11170 [Gemmatimonadaceae bacterium]
MPMSDKDRKILWGRSGNQCAICKTPLVLSAVGEDAESIVGDEAHIVAQGKAGPRAALLRDDEVDTYPNRILLCKIHHKQVDDQPGSFTIERLHAIKNAHEAAIVERNRPNAPVGWHVRMPHSPDPTPVSRIATGAQLDAAVDGVMAFHFDHDELHDAVEIERVSQLFQAISDYRNVFDLLGVGERIRQQHAMGDLIREIGTGGFSLFGARYMGQATADGNTAPWPMARLVLKRSPDLAVLLAEGEDEVPTDAQGFEIPATLPSYVESDEIFASRLAESFPGAQCVEEITDPVKAIDRLTVMFRDPLHQRTVDPGGYVREVFPFWWFRGHGNMHIRSFRRLGPDKCLLDERELSVRRVAACRLFLSSSMWDFLYVEASAEDPVGVYDYPVDHIQQRLAERTVSSFGSHIDEEYAIWQGRPIRLAEAEDGAAIIDGELRRVRNAERRIRFLAPYNMIICGNRHVINESDVDVHMQEYLDGILNGERTIDELARFVQQLKKPRRYLSSYWD